ncbi:coiled-coil domain-containing protein 134-like [Tachypleus tridentatus]|uniref:coiled-coil domain-containing protein 134-like n=1 Tax=Tachypleus tridentatus TaxID=6853 RepID=UPI003FD473B9
MVHVLTVRNNRVWMDDEGSSHKMFSSFLLFNRQGLMLSKAYVILRFQAWTGAFQASSGGGRDTYATCDCLFLSLQIFIQTHKRKEQLEVVKTIVSFADFEKQYKMVDILLKKLFEVLTKAKINLESSGYIPGGEFPELETVREALSQLLENTALFGEILLRLPDITHSILKKHKDWLVLAQWTLGFANSTGLYDTKTSELTYLMTQELNMTERDPNYINPYKMHSKKVVHHIPENVKKEEKKKKKTKRGPKLSGSRHGEL